VTTHFFSGPRDPQADHLNKCNMIPLQKNLKKMDQKPEQKTKLKKNYKKIKKKTLKHEHVKKSLFLRKKKDDPFCGHYQKMTFLGAQKIGNFRTFWPDLFYCLRFLKPTDFQLLYLRHGYH
jgi:hypothetical protein